MANPSGGASSRVQRLHTADAISAISVRSPFFAAGFNERVTAQILKLDELERRNMRRFKHHCRRRAGIERLAPALDTETPSIPLLQPGEPPLWRGR